MKPTNSLKLNYPVVAYLEITNLCNNNCLGCYNPYKNVNKSACSAGQWESIIYKLKPYINYINITGGEPTTREDFFDLLNILEQNSINFSIYTNGRWNKTVEFIDKIKKHKYFNSLVISLYGYNSDAHDEWTQVKGSYSETVKNIKLAAGDQLRVDLSTVITSENYNKIGELIDLAIKLKVSSVGFSRYYENLGDINKKLLFKPSEDQLLRSIQDINYFKHKLKNKLQISFSSCFPECFIKGETSACLAGLSSLAVDPFGNVKPCFQSSYCAGNILKSELLEIWNSSQMENWRNFLPSECSECVKVNVCNGGCKALAFELKKDPLMKKPIKIQKDDTNNFMKINLNKNTRPKKNVEKIQKNNGNFIIINKANFSIINAKGLEILNKCSGDLSLFDLQNIYGKEVLDFIFSLYQKGLVVVK